jgi:hypothetical protein
MHIATHTQMITYILTHKQLAIPVPETYQSLYFHKNRHYADQFHRLVA